MDILVRLWYLFLQALLAVFGSPLFAIPVCILCVAFVYRLVWQMVGGRY